MRTAAPTARESSTRRRLRPPLTAALLLVMLAWLAAVPAQAQGEPPPPATPAAAPVETPPEDGIESGGYHIRQSIEFGGRIVDFSGSGQLWNTFVNLHSGPRLLEYNLELKSLTHESIFFDRLTFHNFGYGGDPNNVSSLRVAKDKIYTFSGSFRRDRNFWDYNLLANPLNPTTSNPTIIVNSSPHRFETVRRNLNLALILAPASPVRVRLGFNHNISEGPSFNSFHEGTDILTFQDWRNRLQTYQIGVDFRFLPRTTISYDQFIARHRGDTTQAQASFGYQLANGTLVDIGLPVNTGAGQPCVAPVTNPATTPPTFNPTCNGYTAYNRSGNIRGLYPTEQLSFASDYFARVNFSGRLLYSASNSDVADLRELGMGLVSRTRQRVFNFSGPTHTRRINVTADLGFSWEINDRASLTNSFRWTDYRIPGRFDLAETSLFGTTMLTAPTTFNPATCPAPFTAATCPSHTTSSPADVIAETFNRYLGQDMKGNTTEFEYNFAKEFGVRVGYRFRNRFIQLRRDETSNLLFYPTLPNRGACAGQPLATDGTCRVTVTATGQEETEINEHSFLFGASSHLLDKIRLNFDMELLSADQVFTRVSPRDQQHYKFRGQFRPREWANLGFSFNLLRRQNDIPEVRHRQHNLNYAFTAAFARGETWALDLHYGYNDIESATNICFVTTPAPSGALKCGATAFLQGISTYDSTDHFAGMNFMWKPVRQLTTHAGYSVNSVNGSTLTLNRLAPLGPVQLNYHLPSAGIMYQPIRRWALKADWNHYGYNEKSDPGFTAPRDFRGNVVTLAVRYAF
ncbi:MAG: hypothetical protein ABIP81_05460 [Terriglobales bacterium]